MKKLYLLFLALFIATNIYALDSDMDGVSDDKDKCPNTPFTDLVDISGCTHRSLVPDYHYDLIVGFSYTNDDYTALTKTNTLSTTLQADYYYKNYSFQASTALYTTSGKGYSQSGLQDSFLGAAYQVNTNPDLNVRISVGAVLPTYDTSLSNNKTDYTAGLSVSYNVEKMNIFGGYNFTMINDTDYNDGTTIVSYQNTNAYTLGVGYNVSNTLYVSGAYNLSDSIYTGVEDVETASLYTYNAIDAHWFSIFSFAYGLSESASQSFLAVKVGYYF